MNLCVPDRSCNRSKLGYDTEKHIILSSQLPRLVVAQYRAVIFCDSLATGPTANVQAGTFTPSLSTRSPPTSLSQIISTLMWAQAASSKTGSSPAKEYRSLIVRLSTTVWQQPALAVSRRSPPPRPTHCSCNPPRCERQSSFHKYSHKVGFRVIHAYAAWERLQ